MNQGLCDELLAMQKEDFRVREELLKAGLLGEGYQPRMEAVHRKNAARLREIVGHHGWPGRALVGDDGARAAWLVLQHAIGEPDLQRGYLPLLQKAAAEGDVPAWQPAYLIDRICFYEGRPQVYGTQWDWNDEGVISLWHVVDPQSLDELRRSVGLPPLGDRRTDTSEPPVSAQKVIAHREEMNTWARKVGWRK